MRLPTILLILTIALAACDRLSFVAVDPLGDAEGLVSVSSAHEDELVAHVQVVNRGLDQPAEVTVNGARASLEEDGRGGRSHVMIVTVDPEWPVVEIVIDVGGGYGSTSIDVPLMTRSGPGSWQPGGGLLLPLALNDSSPDDWSERWRVSMADSAGREMFTMITHSSLPQPLVINSALVPSDAFAARVRTTGLADVPAAPYPIRLLRSFSAHIEIPPRGD